MSNRSPLCDIIDTQFFFCIEKQLDDSLRPISPVAKQAQITQRLLWTAQLPFLLAQFIGEFDKIFSIAMPLMLR
jgi:hypothetical protein